jgi:ribosomal protein L30/L7E
MEQGIETQQEPKEKITVEQLNDLAKEINNLQYIADTIRLGKRNDMLFYAETEITKDIAKKVEELSDKIMKFYTGAAL